MTEFDTAVWWARVRAAGPQRVPAGRITPAGMRRLLEADVTAPARATAPHEAAGTAEAERAGAGAPAGRAVWLLPNLPDGARPSVLDELGLPGPAVEQPNDTARVLATCLRCCWAEPNGPIWPGVAATWPQIVSVFRGITDNRDEAASNRALVGAVRRLAAAGWVRWDEATRTVRLGPRVVTWSEPERSSLRELWRMMPAPSHVDASSGEDAPSQVDGESHVDDPESAA